MKGGVLVSGASSGIGRACASVLSKAGFRVYAGVRDVAAYDPSADSNPRNIVPVEIDLVSGVKIREAVEALKKLGGRHPLFGLVNNAGAMITGPAGRIDLNDVRKLFEVNLFGHWKLTQLCLPQLRESQGRIVNIGSTNGRLSGRSIAAYSATKHALEALSESLALECAADGISVTIIEPGAIRTALWDKVLDWEDKHGDWNDSEASLVRALERRKKLVKLSNSGNSPDTVANAVLRALTDRKPAYRYVVGRDAWLRVAAERVLPKQVLIRLRQSRS